jgi:heterodisulfide reductase subunit C
MVTNENLAILATLYCQLGTPCGASEHHACITCSFCRAGCTAARAKSPDQLAQMYASLKASPDESRW